MLKKIFIDNYKTFDNFEMELDGVNLLIGNNGVGKSSLLMVLSNIRDFSVYGILKDPKTKENRFGGNTVTRWDNKKIQSFELNVEISGAQYIYRLKFDDYGHPAKTRTLLEEVVCDNSTVFRFEEGIVHLFNDVTFEDKVQYPFDWHQSALATIFSRNDNKKLIIFKNWLSQISWIRINPWAMIPYAQTEDTLLMDDASNFASWYRYIRQNCEIDKVSAYIAELQRGNNVRDISINGSGNESRELIIKSRISDGKQTNGYNWILSDLSEGQRALMVLYGVLHFQVMENTLVAIDEPDNFISLSEIQVFLRSLIEKAEDSNSQVIITSHNPEALNYLARQYGKVFMRENGLQTRVKNFDENEYPKLSPSECVARSWLE